MSKLVPRPLLALLPLFCSCAMSPPYKSDGPVQAEGVTVTLAGQKCDFETSTDPGVESLGGELEINLRVQITNGTQQAVDFDPANLRLTVGDSAEPPAHARGAFNIAAGASEMLDARFEKKGPLGCNTPMTLNLGNVVHLGGHPLELKHVSFVASAN
jgi:hypothetical protein